MTLSRQITQPSFHFLSRAFKRRLLLRTALSQLDSTESYYRYCPHTPEEPDNVLAIVRDTAFGHIRTAVRCLVTKTGRCFTL